MCDEDSAILSFLDFVRALIMAHIHCVFQQT